MSEKLLKFLLSELKIIRIVCKKDTCGAILELPLRQAGRRHQHFECPVCGTDFRADASDKRNHLEELADAVKRLEGALNDRVGIELVLPGEE